MHELGAFLDGEECRLLRIDEDRDDDLVEKPRAALDDIDVTEGQGIERSGIDCCCHMFSGL